MKFIPRCDKCDQEVPDINNAALIRAAAHRAPATVLQMPARHFLPVFRGTTMICEGSPSGAQYIEGQPRDIRGYDYNPDLAQQYRAAFEALRASS